MLEGLALLFAVFIIILALLITYVYLSAVAKGVQRGPVASATYQADLDFWFANFVSRHSGLIVDDSPAARQQISSAVVDFVRDPRYVPYDAYSGSCVFEPGAVLCDDVYFCRRRVPSDLPCEGLPLRPVDYWNGVLLLDRQFSPTSFRVGVTFVRE